MIIATETFSDADVRGMRAQWRGSLEGLRWTPWYPLQGTVATVPRGLPIKQVRVFINGRWQCSPPGTTEPVR